MFWSYILTTPRILGNDKVSHLQFLFVIRRLGAASAREPVMKWDQQLQNYRQRRPVQVVMVKWWLSHHSPNRGKHPFGRNNISWHEFHQAWQQLLLHTLRWNRVGWNVLERAEEAEPNQHDRDDICSADLLYCYTAFDGTDVVVTTTNSISRWYYAWFHSGHVVLSLRLMISNSIRNLTVRRLFRFVGSEHCIATTRAESQHPLACCELLVKSCPSSVHWRKSQ